MTIPLDPTAADQQLASQLVARGRLTQEQLVACLEIQRASGGPMSLRLSQILVERGLVDSVEVHNFLSTAVTPRYGDDHPTAMDPRQRPAPLPNHGVGPIGSGPWTPGGQAKNLDAEIRRAMADPSLRIGRYVRLEELGRGGMGVVYRCYDPQLERSVAIKMILDARDAGEEALVRFQREARAAAKLQHSGIVALHEVGEHQGSPYLVMDFVEGESFDDLLKREEVSQRRIAEIVSATAEALHHAHEAGVTHRDVKPQNVMLNAQGDPQIMDFGLARDTSARQQLTQTGQIMGTPAYMAPEQADSDAKRQGPWTDVYALGAVLYRALTGRPVFQADSQVGLLTKVLLEPPVPLHHIEPGISIDLSTIAMRCLEKDPERRYSSAAAVAAELQRFMKGEGIIARPAGRAERCIRWVGRNRALSGAVLVVSVVVVGALIAVGYVAEKAELEAIRREEKARILGKQEAAHNEEETIRKERERTRHEAAKSLQREVAEVLNGVRSGDVLGDLTIAEVAKNRILAYREADTVQLLSSELDMLADQLAEKKGLSIEKELFLRFLCEVLTVIRIRDYSVASLGRYLHVELSLPTEKRNQLRVVPVGKALCLIGGAEADALVLEARDGFGTNQPFWGQVQRFYRQTGVEPELGGETAPGYSNRGLARFHKGDLDGAMDDYSRALQIDPTFVNALINRGHVREAKGDLDGAIDDYSAAIEIDPSDWASWNTRGVARKNKGELDGAIADYSRAIEINSKTVEAWANRGHLRTRMGDLDAALLDLTRAVEIDPNNSVIWNSLGLVRKLRGDLPGAISDCTRAIEIDPNLSIAWCSRGVAKGEIGDLDGAIADHSRAIEIEPNLKESWFNRGNVRSSLGDIEGAIADYSQVVEIDPNFAKGWINRGKARHGAGDLEGARGDYTRAIEIDPSNAAVWSNRGLARKSMGDFHDATSDFKQALEIDASHNPAWIELGNTLKLEGDLDGALACLNKAVEVKPNSLRALHDRGNVRYAKGDFSGAINDYTRCIEIDPNLAYVWSNRANPRRDKGDIEGAIADCTRAIEIDPEYTAAWSNRGNARKSMGDFHGAIADCTRAIELSPTSFSAWNFRGLARKATGDLDGAIGDYSRAIDINPLSAVAWKSRGNARRLKGDLHQAIIDLTRGIELAPNEASSWGFRGIARMENGDLESAIQDFLRFLEVDPNDSQAPDVRDLIKKLRAQMAGAGAGK